MKRSLLIGTWVVQLGLGILGGVISYVVMQSLSSSTYSEREPVPAYQVNIRPGSMTSFAAAAERSKPAVVHIRAEESEALARERRERERRNNPFYDFFNDRGGDPFGGFFGQPFYRKSGSGSGVIISNDGYIVTNNHVVEFADRVTVTLFDERQFSATIIGKDPSTDLAVLKIEAKGLPILSLANSDEALVGDWVLAVGNPFDYLTSTVTAGIISAKGRNINIIEGEKAIEEFIQTDAVINPGNSGGALVDDQGRLVGINTAIATPTGVYAGYSFAIPSNLMRRIVDDIIAAGGDIERVSLGLELAELNEESAEQLGLSVTSGLVITGLDRGGAAQYAGLLPNDVIRLVNGKKVSRFADLEKEIRFLKSGDTIQLTIIRKGKQMELPLKL